MERRKEIGGGVEEERDGENEREGDMWAIWTAVHGRPMWDLLTNACREFCLLEDGGSGG